MKQRPYGQRRDGGDRRTGDGDGGDSGRGRRKSGATGTGEGRGEARGGQRRGAGGPQGERRTPRDDRPRRDAERPAGTGGRTSRGPYAYAMLPDGDAPRFEERPVADVEAVSQGRPQVDAAPDDTAADTAQGAPVVATDQPVLPGLKPVLELLASDPARIDTVFIRRGRRTPDTDRLMDLCREMRVRFSLVEGQVLDKLYAGGHQGVVARLFEAGYVELDDLLRDAPDAPLPLIIALDQVQDPGNAGTLARSLYALGGAGLIVPRHNAAYLGAGAHRAAAGALEKLPVARVANLARALDEAAEAGYAIYGAMCGEGSVNAFTATLRTPCVLVLGNEDKGIRPNVAKRCDTLLHIPMLRDFDSFNVAQAGALLLGCFAAPLLRDR